MCCQGARCQTHWFCNSCHVVMWHVAQLAGTWRVHSNHVTFSDTLNRVVDFVLLTLWCREELYKKVNTFINKIYK